MDDDTMRWDDERDAGRARGEGANAARPARSGDDRHASSAQTDELDLDVPAGPEPRAYPETQAYPDLHPTTKAMPVVDGGNVNGGAGDAGGAWSDAPTARFEAVPVHPAPEATAPTPSPSAAPNAAPAAAPTAAPFPAPYPASPAPARPSRPVGPNGFARFGAIVLSLLLAPAGVVLIATAILLSITEAINAASSSLLGIEMLAVPGAEWRIAMLAVGAVLLLLGGLTARISGAGAGVTGLLLVLGGIVALVWPTAVGDWLVRLFVDPEELGIAELTSSLNGTGSIVLGGVAIVVGALLLGVAASVHGVRRAGWNRGRGL